MGIPSYYKKLADTTKGLISRTYQGKASALYFDFNCMIYHCARRSNTTLPPYPGPDGQEEWETLLLEDIVKYIVKVWQATGSPQEVFLAVDGVVPMAKIKQQRHRRFKSVWLTHQEIQEGLRDNKPSWDTNCITPGTRFMKRLTERLQKLCSLRTHWSVSGPDQPGEGEHKIMAKLRAQEASDDAILIYGLDADLILLTLLNAKRPAFLVREASEMGVVQLDGFGEEQFSYFSVDILKAKTVPADVDLISYGAAMSLLGNDFLPHSLTVKMRDDGHAKVLQRLRSLSSQGLSLVIQEGDRWMVNHQALWSILKAWASEEDTRMLHMLKKKLQWRGSQQSTLETKPLEWNVESGLVWKQNGEWTLAPSWRDVYRSQWLSCTSLAEQRSLCREYLFGLQWILDYYLGQAPVEMTWCYPRLVPPLWCDLVDYLETQIYEPIVLETQAPIQPGEQLAMVLPLSSWHLVETPSFQRLPDFLPQFWPIRFEMFSAGRTRLWECEPLLPLLPIERLRSAAKTIVDCGLSK